MEAIGSVVPPSTSPYTFPFVPSMSNSSVVPSSSMPSMSPSGSSVSTPLFCCVLSLLSLLGVSGNLYTLILIVRRRRTKRRRGGGGITCCSLSLPVPSCLANKSSFSSPVVSSSPPSSSSPSSSSSYLHMQVLSLALADLLYLLTAPFIVYDSLGSGWAFGELGCRLLLSLDLLTMHASIFTLTAMSLDRCRAVADPLHAPATASSRSQGLLRIGLAWGLAVALSLPMMITLHLLVDRQGTLCVPAWDEQSSKVYLSVLFCTSILGPGLAIGALYATLGRLYWVSQTRPAWARGPGSSTAYPPRAPKPKVLLLILGIVLAFWACFLPFWVWQLLPLYRPDMLRTLPVSTQVTVNRVLTCLTYGNSCVNPFFYTLLTGNNRRRRNNNPQQAAIMSSANQLCRKSSPPQ